MPFVQAPTLIDRVREKRYKTDHSRELKMRREEIYQGTLLHPWAFLSARDIDGSALVKTVDRGTTGGASVRDYPSEREYLKALVYELYDPDNFLVVMQKTRQILASFTVLLGNAFWPCLKYANTEAIVSRNKEEGAIKLVREKVVDTWKQLPPWYRALCPIANKPQEQVKFLANGAHILAVSQNFPNSESRGDSAGIVVVDEADYQSNLPQIITSTLPMAGKIILLSSAKKDGEGSRIMKLYGDRAKTNQSSSYSPSPGVVITKAKMGRTEDGEKNLNLCLIEAFPDEMKQRGKIHFFINQSAYEQEMEGSRVGSEGKEYFPEVRAYGGPAFYHKKVDSLPRGITIHRGFDFGSKRPACTWATIDKAGNRCHILYDLLGEDIDPWSFAKLVRYLSGEISEEDAIAVRSDANGYNPVKDVLDRLKETDRTPPWFASDASVKFSDHSGHEAKQTIAGGPGRKPQTYAEVFMDEGINVNPRYWHKERRELVVRHLLKPRADGRPSMEIDVENAPIVMTGLYYGLVRPKNDKGKPAEEPVHDDYFHDVYDSMGYIVVDEFENTDFDRLDYAPGEGPTRNAEDSPADRAPDLPLISMSRYAPDQFVSDIDRLYEIGR